MTGSLGRRAPSIAVSWGFVDPANVAPCAAGPHTALAVIFNPVVSTHHEVHMYHTKSAGFDCGKLPDNSLRMRRESYCLESHRLDHQFPHFADGRLRLMACLFRRSHTQWYPSSIDGWVKATLCPTSLLAAVLRCPEAWTRCGLGGKGVFRTGSISLSSTGSYPTTQVVQVPVAYRTVCQPDSFLAYRGRCPDDCTDVSPKRTGCQSLLLSTTKRDVLMQIQPPSTMIGVFEHNRTAMAETIP